jgi:hypothetical protein
MDWACAALTIVTSKTIAIQLITPTHLQIEHAF